MFIKQGNSGKQVRMIQECLTQLSFPLNADGVYGSRTTKVVEKFQERYNLTVDGVVGTNTYNKLLNVIISKQRHTKLNTYIPKQARTYIGQEEISGNMGFKTPTFHKLMISVGFKKTHPWCAYFTELVWRESYSKIYNREIGNTVSKLFSPSVMKTWNNFSNNTVFKRSFIPTPGALIVYQSSRNKYFGHIGIVDSISEENPFYINTIEGNTNDGGGREGYIVAEKVRTMDYREKNGLNLVGFIHPGLV